MPPKCVIPRFLANLATCQLEFRFASHISGDPRYAAAVDQVCKRIVHGSDSSRGSRSITGFANPTSLATASMPQKSFTSGAGSTHRRWTCTRGSPANGMPYTSHLSGDSGSCLRGHSCWASEGTRQVSAALMDAGRGKLIPEYVRLDTRKVQFVPSKVSMTGGSDSYPMRPHP